MNIGTYLYLIILFVVFSPGILFSVPSPNSKSKWVRVFTHGFLFSVAWLLTHRTVNNILNKSVKEGAQTLDTTNIGGTDVAISSASTAVIIPRPLPPPPTKPQSGPIILMQFTNNNGSVQNDGSLGNRINSDLYTSSKSITGPNGTSSVYINSSSLSKVGKLTEFGTLYNFTVTWWQNNYTNNSNCTSIYLGNSKYGSRLLGTNNVNNSTLDVCNDGNIDDSGRRSTGFTVPYKFKDKGSTWYHYAIVCDLPVDGGKGTVTYYQNGGADSTSFNYTNYVNGFQSFFYFNNSLAIYNLSVYDSALSLDQIQTIYNRK